MDEMVQAASAYHLQLGNKMKDIVTFNQAANKQNCVDRVCCSTHACSLMFLQDDPKNICREVNKLTVNCFFKELGLVAGDAKLDPLLAISEENKAKLNAIMPILNSVQLWGRYKQKQPKDHTEVVIHVAPYLKQSYQKDHVYRNVNWVYGLPDMDTAFKMGGQAIYCIEVPEQFLNSVIRFPDNKLKALPPF